MFWLGVCVVCGLGMVALGDTKESTSVNNTNKYTKEYVRENLSSWYYDNYQCESIAYQLQDNWLRDDVDKMLNRGYKFYECIEKLKADDKLHF